MSIKVLSIEDDGVAAIACEGDLDGLAMNNGDTADLEEHLGEGWANKRVVLDLSESEYMDSAAVGWLLSLHKAFEKAGGRLVVCGIQPPVKRVLELMRIEQVVPMAEDREAALEQVRAGGPNDA